MSESSVTVPCSSCERDNLVYLGDATDLTQPDVEGFRCGFCTRITRFGEIESGVIENGQPLRKAPTRTTVTPNSTGYYWFWERGVDEPEIVEVVFYAGVGSVRLIGSEMQYDLTFGGEWFGPLEEPHQ